MTGEILTGDLRTASAAVQREVAAKAREVIQARREDAARDAQDRRSLAGQQARTRTPAPQNLGRPRPSQFLRGVCHQRFRRP